VREKPERHTAIVTSSSTEDLIPADHPIRQIRAVVDDAPAELDDELAALYSRIVRLSVPPEQLLKAAVLMAPYSVRSERTRLHAPDHRRVARPHRG
jgi:transposase